MISARKTYRLGTHRLVEPAATLARVRPLLPVLGITRIANVTGLDSIGLPVIMVCRPNARSIAVSQGKGLDLMAARASGVMEAVETYHAEHITLPLKLGSYEALRYTHPLAAIRGLPRCADSRFQPDLPMLWIEGQDLLSNSPCWLPYELVHADYTLPFPPGSGCFAANTNGLASGNHWLEATLHGACEVIERDANTLWNLQHIDSQRQTGLALDSISDSLCCEVLDRYHRAGLEVRVWETTTDVGVAAFLCQVRERSDHPFRLWPRPTAGSGCHPVRQIALLRALTEAAQVRVTFIAGSRDDLGPEEYPSQAPPDPTEEMDIHRPVRRFQDVPTWETETFEEDLDWVLQRLETVGIQQVIAVDLTHPVLQLPVVKVVIPGLEGADEAGDYVPGARACALLETWA
jgi:ribosomal protein S12 methylthiotransferase accessory factor